ncbi:hypothetical protein GCM10023205_52610 [Yinghuangia aomiensis]|uniref:Uncharacterized protein n=1 Tax=Yinghuangia aomiensis TaxID=676205 RepID=A0ABP9HTH5_9ACTN
MSLTTTALATPEPEPNPFPGLGCLAVSNSRGHGDSADAGAEALLAEMRAEMFAENSLGLDTLDRFQLWRGMWTGYPSVPALGLAPSAVTLLDGGLWLHHTAEAHIEGEFGVPLPVGSVLTLVGPCGCGGVFAHRVDDVFALIALVDLVSRAGDMPLCAECWDAPIPFDLA